MGIDSTHLDTVKTTIDSLEFYYHTELLKRIYRSLELYQDSQLHEPSNGSQSQIQWKNRPPYKISWVDHLNTSLQDFVELGFPDHRIFYDISEEKRNQFLSTYFTKIQECFPEGFEGLVPSEEFIHRSYIYYRELHQAAQNLSTN